MSLHLMAPSWPLSPGYFHAIIPQSHCHKSQSALEDLVNLTIEVGRVVGWEGWKGGIDNEVDAMHLRGILSFQKNTAHSPPQVFKV